MENNLFQKIEKARNLLYINMPIGEVNAFELVKLVRQHIANLDKILSEEETNKSEDANGDEDDIYDAVRSYRKEHDNKGAIGNVDEGLINQLGADPDPDHVLYQEIGQTVANVGSDAVGDDGAIKIIDEEISELRNLKNGMSVNKWRYDDQITLLEKVKNKITLQHHIKYGTEGVRATSSGGTGTH
jgi:hypothetical protein